MLKALTAISDGTRLRMLRILSKGERCACELPALVRVSQPAVSQHLSVLKSAGVVRMRKDGKKRIYSLSERGRKILADIGRW